MNEIGIVCIDVDPVLPAIVCSDYSQSISLLLALQPDVLLRLRPIWLVYQVVTV